MKRICCYYLADTDKSEKGYCVYEAMEKMQPHPTIYDRWILHPVVNPMDWPVAANKKDCNGNTICPKYTPEQIPSGSRQ